MFKIIDKAITIFVGDFFCRQYSMYIKKCNLNHIIYSKVIIQIEIFFFILCVNYSLVFFQFSSHSKNCHSFGDVTIAGEGLQILTPVRHVWPLSSKSSLACHTYYTGPPCIVVISEDQCNTITPNALRLAVKLSLPVLTTQVCRGWDLNTLPSA